MKKYHIKDRLLRNIRNIRVCFILLCVSRYILASGGCAIVIGCRPDDTLYVTLPLYHSVGGMIALAGSMKHGFTMALRKKFSAKNYWADCVKYRVTVSVTNSSSCLSFLCSVCLINTKFR